MPGVPQLLRGGRGAGGSLHHCMVHTGMLEAWMDARALKTNGPAAWVGAKRKERQKLLAVPGVPQPLHGLNTRGLQTKRPHSACQHFRAAGMPVAPPLS